MNRPHTESGHSLGMLPGLEKVVDRLKPGMDLNGRIVDTLGQGIFILRILGNNILTESSYPFKRFDEVVLHVQATLPKLVFTLRPANMKGGSGIYA